MKSFALLIVLTTSIAAQEGKQLVLDTCVQCHDLQWVNGQQKTEAQWRQTVNMMIWRGAQLKPGESATIAKYLSVRTGFSRSTDRPAEVGPPLPAGKGRDLVAAQCVQCHDLTLTTTARKSLPEWRHSVTEMVRLGAKLTGSEIELVSRYLARAFGS